MRMFSGKRKLMLLVGLVSLAGGLWYGVVTGASRRFRQMEEATQRRDYRTADRLFQHYVQSHPGDAEALLLAARNCRRLGAFTQATVLLKAAEPRAAIEDLDKERRLLLLHSGKVSATVSAIEEHAEKRDNDAPLWLEAIAEGALRRREGMQARRAANAFLQVATTPEQMSQAYLWLGQADKLLNELGEALAHFRQAVKLAPHHARSRVLLVASLVHFQPAEAIEHLDALRAAHSDDPEVWFQQARLHRSLGELPEAIRLLDRVLETSPKAAPALVERARVEMELNCPEQAERYLRQAVHAAPQDRGVMNAFSDCLRMLDRHAEAKEARSRVEQMDRAEAAALMSGAK